MRKVLASIKEEEVMKDDTTFPMTTLLHKVCNESSNVDSYVSVEIVSSKLEGEWGDFVLLTHQWTYKAQFTCHPK